VGSAKFLPFNYFSMKNSALLLSAVFVLNVLLNVGCENAEPVSTLPPDETAPRVQFIHASPNAGTLIVSVDGTALDTLRFKGSSRYVQLTAGSPRTNRRLVISDSASPNTIRLDNVLAGLDSGKSYSVFLADSLSRLKALKVADNFIGLSGNQVGIRFINLSPKSPSVELVDASGATSFGGSASAFVNKTYTGTDTTIINTFFGATANVFSMRVLVSLGIARVDTLSGGVGYFAPPSISVAVSPTPGATNAAVGVTGLVNSRVSGVSVIASGSGYTVPPIFNEDAVGTGMGTVVNAFNQASSPAQLLMPSTRGIFAGQGIFWLGGGQILPPNPRVVSVSDTAVIMSPAATRFGTSRLAFAPRCRVTAGDSVVRGVFPTSGILVGASGAVSDYFPSGTTVTRINAADSAVTLSGTSRVSDSTLYFISQGRGLMLRAAIIPTGQGRLLLNVSNLSLMSGRHYTVFLTGFPDTNPSTGQALQIGISRHFKPDERDGIF
jgi:hypothetical protein